MIHHLALRTHDVDRLVAFYREWFGLHEVRDSRPRSVWLGLGEGVLMIELANESEPSIAAGSLELLAFRVTVEQRQALRARVVLEAETEHTLYFRDPDGRRVAVSSYPL
ncbi:MAG TPA: VOC family protein [Polyangiales bacterium]|nr:VOC family protein [Polyangiales bacterium]